MRLPQLALLVLVPSLRADVLEEAHALLRQHKEEAAVALLRDGVAKNPTDDKAAALLAEVLLEEERFAEADQVINSAVKTNPESARLHVVRGDIVFREGQPFEADKEYKAANRLDGRNALAYFGVARIFDIACLRASAAKLIKTAHDLSPKNPIIATRYLDLEGNSQGNIERWQDELASLDEQNSPLARHLTERLAVAKGLQGKTEFELATEYAKYEVPLLTVVSNRRFRGVGLNISVGRAKTKLMVDTGAGGIIVQSKFAERAGIQRLAATEIGGLGNGPPVQGWIGFAPQIEIGGLVFRNCVVRVAERFEQDDAEGLIGSDVFRRFLVKLDFARQKLELDPLPGPAWDGVQPVDRVSAAQLPGFSQMLIKGHYLLIPGKVSEEEDTDKSPGLFLIDTGSARTLVSTGVAADVTRMRDDHDRRLRGLSGEIRKVYTADKVVLEFATFRQRNLGALTVDLSNMSRSAGTEITAVLGMQIFSLFRSVTLDYRDGLVKFEYKP